jgi:hypothetical protein
MCYSATADHVIHGSQVDQAMPHDAAVNALHCQILQMQLCFAPRLMCANLGEHIGRTLVYCLHASYEMAPCKEMRITRRRNCIDAIWEAQHEGNAVHAGASVFRRYSTWAAHTSCPFCATNLWECEPWPQQQT